MKCREMNPGNQSGGIGLVHGERPSMKCREMNPGNPSVRPSGLRNRNPLNEVPGDESRQ